MQLDNKALYKLTKVGIKNADSKFFSEGDTHTGQAEVLHYPNYPKKPESVLLIGEVLTSTIEKTTDLENGNYLVETKNSIYTLEKLNDEAN